MIYQNRKEICDINCQQIFTLEKKLYKNEFDIETVGDLLPGNILITDLNKLSTIYMNRSGCNILKHDVAELEQLGPEYYQKFFVSDEINGVIGNYLTMQKHQDTSIYNFAHRVKAVDESSYKWYFAAAKLIFTKGERISHKMILIVNEVDALGVVARKLNAALEEGEWMKKNFNKFRSLTKRESQIVGLLAKGKSSTEISDMLFLSKLTIHTHRRNINTKLGSKSFADIYKFALAFDLIS